MTKAPDVVETFHHAATRLGFPASVLTDNGAIFTAEARNGASAFELELLALGIQPKHSRPYHPQTCGKVERFHQTLKKWLTKHPASNTTTELQTQLDTFADYYNTIRPHRGIGRRTPAQAFRARTKATPRRQPLDVPTQHRIRRDKVDPDGKIILRYKSVLRHLGIGRRYAGTRVMLLVADRDVRVINDDGELLATFTIDPAKQYQIKNRPGLNT